MTRNVVILSSVEDIHSQLVKRRLDERAVPCSILDPGAFTTDVLAGTLSTADTPRTFRWQDTTFDSETVIWWRRVNSPPADDRVWNREIRKFLIQERRHALHGLFFSLGCRIVNDPFAEDRADHIPLQLEVARRLGIAIPETCITNDLEVAEAFYQRLTAAGKRCIFKGFSGCKYHMGETRVLDGFNIDRESLSLAPVCFQECIERGFDLRINVIGDRIFAASIRSDFEDLEDWRLDGRPHFADYPLEPGFAGKLKALVRELGLDWGAIDVRVDPNGRPVFLEINPSGQFLFVEAELSTPLSAEFAALLAESKPRSKRAA